MLQHRVDLRTLSKKCYRGMSLYCFHWAHCKCGLSGRGLQGEMYRRDDIVLRDQYGPYMRHTSRITLVVVAILTVGMGPMLTIVSEARADAISSDNIDIYVLVDESSSLSERDIQLEREAVEGIVSLQTIKKRGVRVGIVPFSSGPGSPRRLAGCGLIPVDDGNDLVLAECARRIRRQFGEAGNTDFATAFDFVAEQVKSSRDDSRLPVIVLLTDGIFDPNGDQVTSAEELAQLNASIARLKESEIPIWGLGFGKANLAALEAYSTATKKPQGNCDAEANARIVVKENLAIQLKVIIGEATCADVTPPEPTPSKRFVHPLIDTVVITVVARDSTKPTLTSPNGKDLCPTDFVEISPKTFQCVVTEDGSNAGTWTAAAGPGALASWEFFGNVLLTFDQCPGPLSLLMSRLDGKPIDFSAAVLWPSLQIAIGDRLLGRVSLQEESVSLVKEFGSLPKFGLLNARSSDVAKRDGLPRLNVRAVTCDLSLPPPPTTSLPPPTTSPPTTTIPPPPCDVTDTCPPPPPYWLLAAVAAAAVSAFALLRWRKSRMFPPGTSILQRSPVNERAWIDPIGDIGSDIGGQKKVAVVVDRVNKKISIDAYGGACDYVISTSGGQLLIEAGAKESEGSDEETKSPSSQAPARVEPFGPAIVLEQGIVIRVEKPEEDSEEDEITS